jgi:phospholipid-binding lipoprotein MlaA
VNRVLRRVGIAVALALGLALAGCASIPSGTSRVPQDPLEPMNRAIYAVNDTFDAYFLRPIAKAYVDYVHEGIRGVFSNLYGNVGDVWTSFNQLLQGKPREAIGDLSRFVINSTFGFFGVADIASSIGLEKHYEDFGQTLGVWGLEAGPYLVLPLLGPSTIRDSVGVAAGFAADPVSRYAQVPVRNTYSAVRFVDIRASLFPSEKLLDGAALDKYSFIRDGYLQRRRNLVFDGNPPQLKE